MQVYFLRHAIAIPRGTPGYPNDDRPLTEEGRSRFKRSLGGIRALAGAVDIVLSSPMARALETAKMASSALGCRGRVTVANGLLPGSTVEGVLDLLEEHRKHDSVVLVGHEPLLGACVHYLLAMKEPRVEFKKGGMCRIDIASPDRPASGRLVWHATPKLLRLCSEKRTHDDQPPHTPSPLPRTAHRR